MVVDVIPEAGSISPKKVSGSIAVVIDVFRATSVICEALHNGAAAIIPVTDIESCNTLYSTLKENSKGKRILRGGERNTYRIDGFELDNSPLSYNKKAVDDSVVIMTTTNGTRAVNGCLGAKEIVIASLLNASFIADYIISKNLDAVLVCSGRKNTYTIEDGYCAGLIAKLLNDRAGYDFSDLAWQEADFYTRFSNNPRAALSHCEHYRNIKDRLADDVAFCLQENIYEIIPKVYYNENSCSQEIR